MNEMTRTGRGPETAARQEHRKNMLNTKETAAYLGISMSYLYKLMGRRIIPYYRPSGKIAYFDISDLDNWQHSAKVCSQAELDSQASQYCGAVL